MIKFGHHRLGHSITILTEGECNNAEHQSQDTQFFYPKNKAHILIIPMSLVLVLNGKRIYCLVLHKESLKNIV